MDELIRIKKKGQVTIPAKILEMFRLKPDDYFLLHVRGDHIELTPQAVIPKSQEYFWTKRWQEGERKADEDIKEGRVSAIFENPEDFLSALKEENGI